MAHASGQPQRFSLRGRALAAVVGALPGKPYWTRVGTDSPRPLRRAWRGSARRVLASPGASHGREEGGGSDPPFLTAAAAPASVHRRTRWRTVNTPLGGVAPSTVIPGGKAAEPMRKPRPPHRPQAVRYAHETPTQAATTPTRCGSKQAPSRNIAQATFSSRSATERGART